MATNNKVKLAWITKESSRNASYRKRKQGLMKKVADLCTLCGIEACAVVYRTSSDLQPDEVWPAKFDQAYATLAKFKTLPETEQSKNMVNHEAFLKQRVQKLKEQLLKQLKDNREMELTDLLYQNIAAGRSGLELNHQAGIEELNDLAWLIDKKTDDILRLTGGLPNNQQSALLIPNQNNLAADDEDQQRRMMMNGNHDYQIGSTSSAAADHAAVNLVAAHNQRGMSTAGYQMEMEALERQRSIMAGHYCGDQHHHHQK